VQGRLVLTGRSQFPEESQWDAYAAQHDERDPTARQIRRLQNIQRLGGEILLVRADAGILAEMEQAFEAAEQKFGPINGVVHAAGLVTGDAFRPLAETDADICKRQFIPKVSGLCVLDLLMQSRPAPDFVLLISSLSSVLGGLRFSAYASANAFLDAFAAWRQRTSAARWISINWDTWMRAEDEQRSATPGSMANEFFMTGAEGVEALSRILAADVGTQVVVSTGDLQSRIDQWLALGPATEEEASASDVPRHPRPHLQTEYRAPVDSLEQTIAGIWQELLGVDRVGVDDSFFELGGDSLLGVQVIARVKKQLAVSVSSVSLYEGPTVASLADVIRSAGAAAPSHEGQSRGDKRREHKLRRQAQPAGGEVLR
jgi:acyl carrier protein